MLQSGIELKEGLRMRQSIKATSFKYQTKQTYEDKMS